MTIVYLGLGSNVGDREKNLQDALNEISSYEGITVRNISSLYETEPVGVKEQPWFLNAVVELETNLPPMEVLGINKAIEKKLHRKETYKWGPRIIDIDLLLYGNCEISEPNLKVPHPEMHLRGFVLIPLAELAPALKIPGKTKLNDLIGELDNEAVKKMNKKLNLPRN